MKELTSRQSEIFEFIKTFFVENQRMPGSKDICEAFGFSSRNSAYDFLDYLEKAGVIELRQDRGEFRSIKLVNYSVVLLDRTVSQ